MNTDNLLQYEEQLYKIVGDNANPIRLLSKWAHAHTHTSPTDDDNYHTLHVEDDVQGIDINDCTSKSLKCTAIHQSHNP